MKHILKGLKIIWDWIGAICVPFAFLVLLLTPLFVMLLLFYTVVNIGMDPDSLRRLGNVAKWFPYPYALGMYYVYFKYLHGMWNEDDEE